MQDKFDNQNNTDQKENILLKLHDYYSQESRNQWSMMWQTSRWFVLILGLFVGIELQEKFDTDLKKLLFILPILGYVISLICIILIRSFYKTNLIYISMLAKIEDELGFNKRKIKCSFPNDMFITWQKYIEDRHKKSSEEFVKDELKYLSLKMYVFISFVFWAFLLIFSIFISLKLEKEILSCFSITIIIFLVVLASAIFNILIKVKKI
ncbi:hypothetical protein HQ544_01515 [Candidatus Falkowbacteria bacterium]|nr:hypothetical protein [Candidatus Falkowbacteria bacterium]